MNEIAREFWQLCEEGEWSPVIPRGRNGSPPTIYDEPMKLRRIMLPDELWQKAQALGDGNGSAGIRQALESQ